ncbi:MAG: hypothetical protein WCJ49_05320, partial [Deltaproteobacteria bacterium]
MCLAWLGLAWLGLALVVCLYYHGVIPAPKTDTTALQSLQNIAMSLLTFTGTLFIALFIKEIGKTKESKIFIFDKHIFINWLFYLMTTFLLLGVVAPFYMYSYDILAIILIPILPALIVGYSFFVLISFIDYLRDDFDSWRFQYLLLVVRKNKKQQAWRLLWDVKSIDKEQDFFEIFCSKVDKGLNETSKSKNADISYRLIIDFCELIDNRNFDLVM